MFNWIGSLESLNKSSDEELLDVMKKQSRRSQKAFEILFKRYEQPLLNYCFRVLRNKEEAHDAKQETFMKIWRNADKFEDHSSGKAWFYAIAHNTCVSMIRKRKPVSSLDESAEVGEERNQTSPVRLTFNKEIRQKIVTLAQQRLSQQEQFILFSTYFDEHFLSVDEIAATLNISKNLVSQKKIRAQKKLKLEMFLLLKDMILFDEKGAYITFDN